MAGVLPAAELEQTVLSGLTQALRDPEQVIELTQLHEPMQVP
jgi:hypothetical protein